MRLILYIFTFLSKTKMILTGPCSSSSSSGSTTYFSLSIFTPDPKQIFDFFSTVLGKTSTRDNSCFMLVMDLNLEQHMSNEANEQIPKEKQAMEESQISATCVTLPLPGKEVSEII